MKKNNRTGSHLFFIEFLIVLFFFLIVSTVCLRMFARAHGITRRADALSHAQAAAASVAAAVEQVITDGIDDTGTEDSGTALLRQAAEYLPDAFLTHLPDSPASQEGLAAAYDEDFQPCAIEDAYYLLTATLAADRPDGSQKETPENQPTDGPNDSQIETPENQPTDGPDDSQNEMPGNQPDEPDDSQIETPENGQEGALETLHITVRDYHQTVIYELSASFHRPTTRKEALQ